MLGTGNEIASIGVIIVFWVLVGGGVGGCLGWLRGRCGTGGLLGVFLGPIGWIVVCVMPATPEAEASYRLAVEREMERQREAEANRRLAAEARDERADAQAREARRLLAEEAAENELRIQLAKRST